MFDIGWQELFIVAVLALIVVGPKDLPRAIRTITQWIRKARMMARDFQAGVDEMVREAELDDVKKQLTEGGNLKDQIRETLDPGGDVSRELGGSLEFDEDDRSIQPPTAAELEAGETMTEAETGGAAETGLPEQFEILNQPVDDDVMPLPTPADDKKTEAT